MDHSTETAPRAGDLLSGFPLTTPLGRKQENCARHGPYIASGVRLPRGREIWDRCLACRAEAEAREQAQREEEAAARARIEFEAKLDQAAIPARFLGKSVDNFKADTEGKRLAATITRDYIENFSTRQRKGEGLIFSGLPGTGKSHLAAAVLQGILPRHVGLYTTCMGAIRAVRETWRKDSERSERQVLEILGDAPLLVLDEIGVQYGTDGEQTIIFDILDRRYREMRPSILLTNQDKAGLKGFIGERAYDRLTETCRWVAFDWLSHRAQARKEQGA